MVRNVLDDAVRRGLLAANPARLAASPRYGRDHHRGRKAWTAEELRCFLDATAGHHGHRWFRLAAYTEVRRGELVGLRWRDVDCDRRRLSIVRTVICMGARMQEAAGKTPNAARTIDLDAPTLELLTAWRAEQPSRSAPTTIALQGIIVGTVLGAATAYQLLVNAAAFGGLDVTFRVPWIELTVLLAITLIASVAAAGWPARRASRIRPAVALRTTE